MTKEDIIFYIKEDIKELKKILDQIDEKIITIDDDEKLKEIDDIIHNDINESFWTISANIDINW